MIYCYWKEFYLYLTIINRESRIIERKRNPQVSHFSTLLCPVPSHPVFFWMSLFFFFLFFAEIENVSCYCHLQKDIFPKKILLICYKKNFFFKWNSFSISHLLFYKKYCQNLNEKKIPKKFHDLPASYSVLGLASNFGMSRNNLFLQWIWTVFIM